MNAIGKYKLLEEMGVGAVGTTYRASDPFQNREMVVKVLNPALAATPELHAQICRHLSLTAELCHPHILRIRDLGEADGAVYIATEFLNGVNLRWHLEHKVLTLADKVDLMVQVSGALAFAHSKGIAHGNLKPSNIFVTDKDATILDFGIGKCLAMILEAGGQTAPVQPNYFAPEQILGKPFSAKSDVFSAAVILYELLAKYPFGADANVVAREIVHTPATPLHELDPQIPEEIDQLLTRALEKDPEKRLARADDFAAGLYLVSQRLLGGVAKSAAAPIAVAPSSISTAVAPPPNVTAPAPPAPVVVAAVAQPIAAAVPPVKSNVAEAPAAQPVKRTPAPKAKRTRLRWLPYAVAAMMTIAICFVFLSRQSIHASQSKEDAQAAAEKEFSAPVPEKQAAEPAPQTLAAPPPSAPAAPAVEVAPEKPAEDESLTQVKSLWASGKYAQALEKVNEILAAHPDNLEGRLWKKKIRAAQEAEAAMK